MFRNWKRCISVSISPYVLKYSECIGERMTSGYWWRVKVIAHTSLQYVDIHALHWKPEMCDKKSTRYTCSSMKQLNEVRIHCYYASSECNHMVKASLNSTFLHPFRYIRHAQTRPEMTEVQTIHHSIKTTAQPPRARWAQGCARWAQRSNA